MLRLMHSHDVSYTEHDVCACLYSLPLISILAAGDKARLLSPAAAAGFLPGDLRIPGLTLNTTSAVYLEQVIDRKSSLFDLICYLGM